MSNKKLRYIFNEISDFLTNKRFLINLLAIFLFLAVVLIGVFTWLRIYTHHGQKLELPNYIDQPYQTAKDDAREKTFEIIVNDSVHIVEKAGGHIIYQNPPGGSLVKEKRKIYVTVTKYQADKIDISDMNLYGENYDQVEASLKRQNISSKIKSFKYDALTQNHILEVWYQGKEVRSRSIKSDVLIVDKGSTLEFVVSSSQGGISEVPSLIGNTLGSAIFMLQPRRLNLEITNKNEIGNREESQLEIIDQDPLPGTPLPTDGTVRVKIKPEP